MIKIRQKVKKYCYTPQVQQIKHTVVMTSFHHFQSDQITLLHTSLNHFHLLTCPNMAESY